jgi:hypothetical protein
MVLVGHVSDYPLSELLFFLSTKRRTGHLTLQHRSITITFTLQSGRLIAAQPSAVDQRLGSRLVADGILTLDQLHNALACQFAEMPGTPLGAILVQQGCLTPSTVQRVLKEQVADCLVQFLITPGGTFTFQPCAVDAAGINLDISIEREVFEAIHRVDELLTDMLEIGTVTLDPDITADALEPIIAESWDLIDALMDDASTVDEVIRSTGWTRPKVIDGLLRLHAHNIVSVRTSDRAEAVAV